MAVAGVLLASAGIVSGRGHGGATAEAAAPVNMSTWVPSDLHATSISGASDAKVPISAATAKSAVMTYFNKFYPASVQNMPVRVTAVRLVHANNSPVSFIGTQDLWLITVDGVPNHWSSDPDSPYSKALFVVSAQTGKVLEEAVTGPSTGQSSQLGM